MTILSGGQKKYNDFFCLIPITVPLSLTRSFKYLITYFLKTTQMETLFNNRIPHQKNIDFRLKSRGLWPEVIHCI